MNESVVRWPVEVALPGGGRVVAAELQGRRRDAGGRWWYRVVLDVPAGAVRPVTGQDYSQVPTETAAGEGAAGWVLQALRHDAPGQRALVLHASGCWAAEGRLTEADGRQARTFLRAGWAVPCETCRPTPPEKR
ncbi:DUF6233 domain-containing protein [Streptomyces sp. NPDC059096]|uniref:DUF6233 domain-containing protein n=1 Tax=Streptomyces sp. NPDC059096 TaxID=3346727 RepID=UPI0036AA9398